MRLAGQTHQVAFGSLSEDKGYISAVCGIIIVSFTYIFIMPTEKEVKKNSNPNGRLCSNCSAGEGIGSAPKLSTCARCGLVFYCCKDCQRAHWKVNHKQHCIFKADRSRQQQNPLESLANVSAAAASSVESSLVNTLPITKKNKHTVVTEAPKKVHVLLSR